MRLIFNVIAKKGFTQFLSLGHILLLWNVVVGVRTLGVWSWVLCLFSFASNYPNNFLKRRFFKCFVCPTHKSVPRIVIFQREREKETVRESEKKMTPFRNNPWTYFFWRNPRNTVALVHPHQYFLFLPHRETISYFSFQFFLLFNIWGVILMFAIRKDHGIGKIAYQKIEVTIKQNQREGKNNHIIYKMNIEIGGDFTIWNKHLFRNRIGHW